MFTFSSDIAFVPSVSNKILGSAPKQTKKQIDKWERQEFQSWTDKILWAIWFV